MKNPQDKTNLAGLNRKKVLTTQDLRPIVLSALTPGFHMLGLNSRGVEE